MKAYSSFARMQFGATAVLGVLLASSAYMSFPSESFMGSRRIAQVPNGTQQTPYETEEQGQARKTSEPKVEARVLSENPSEAAQAQAELQQENEQIRQKGPSWWMKNVFSRRIKEAGLLAGEKANAAGDAAQGAYSSMLQFTAKAPVSMVRFYGAVGIMHGYECFTKGDPTICQTWWESLKDPGGQIGFVAFMGVHQVFHHMVSSSHFGRAYGGYMGMALGSYAQEIVQTLYPHATRLLEAFREKDGARRAELYRNAIDELWNHTMGNADWWREQPPHLASLILGSVLGPMGVDLGRRGLIATLEKVPFFQSGKGATLVSELRNTQASQGLLDGYLMWGARAESEFTRQALGGNFVTAKIEQQVIAQLVREDKALWNAGKVVSSGMVREAWVRATSLYKSAKYMTQFERMMRVRTAALALLRMGVMPFRLSPTGILFAFASSEGGTIAMLLATEKIQEPASGWLAEYDYWGRLKEQENQFDQALSAFLHHHGIRYDVDVKVGIQAPNANPGVHRPTTWVTRPIDRDSKPFKDPALAQKKLEEEAAKLHGAWKALRSKYFKHAEAVMSRHSSVMKQIAEQQEAINAGYRWLLTGAQVPEYKFDGIEGASEYDRTKAIIYEIADKAENMIQRSEQVKSELAKGSRDAMVLDELNKLLKGLAAAREEYTKAQESVERMQTQTSGLRVRYDFVLNDINKLLTYSDGCTVFSTAVRNYPICASVTPNQPDPSGNITGPIVILRVLKDLLAQPSDPWKSNEHDWKSIFTGDRDWMVTQWANSFFCGADPAKAIRIETKERLDHYFFEPKTSPYRAVRIPYLCGGDYKLGVIEDPLPKLSKYREQIAKIGQYIKPLAPLGNLIPDKIEKWALNQREAVKLMREECQRDRRYCTAWLKSIEKASNGFRTVLNDDQVINTWTNYLQLKTIYTNLDGGENVEWPLFNPNDEEAVAEAKAMKARLTADLRPFDAIKNNKDAFKKLLQQRGLSEFGLALKRSKIEAINRTLKGEWKTGTGVDDLLAMGWLKMVPLADYFQRAQDIVANATNKLSNQMLAVYDSQVQGALIHGLTGEYPQASKRRVVHGYTDLSVVPSSALFGAMKPARRIGMPVNATFADLFGTPGEKMYRHGDPERDAHGHVTGMELCGLVIKDFPIDSMGQIKDGALKSAPPCAVDADMGPGMAPGIARDLERELVSLKGRQRPKAVAIVVDANEEATVERVRQIYRQLRAWRALRVPSAVVLAKGDAVEANQYDVIQIPQIRGDGQIALQDGSPGNYFHALWQEKKYWEDLGSKYPGLLFQAETDRGSLERIADPSAGTPNSTDFFKRMADLIEYETGLTRQFLEYLGGDIDKRRLPMSASGILEPDSGLSHYILRDSKDVLNTSEQSSEDNAQGEGSN